MEFVTTFYHRTIHPSKGVVVFRKEGLNAITALLLCLNGRTQCSSLHSKAMLLIMKAAIVM